MVNRELSDEDIARQAEAFADYYSRLYISKARPFVEAIFEDWAESKDFAPGDLAAIHAAMFEVKQAVS